MSDFDLDAFRQQFEQEFPAESDANVSHTEEVENSEETIETMATNENGDDAEPTEPVQEGESEQPSVEGNEPEEPLDQQMEELSQQVKERQSPETNRAFAEMRRKMKELEKAQSFLERIAQSSGVSVDQLMQMYEEREIEERAKQQGIPTEIYKRLNELEKQNKDLQKQAALNRFYGEVDSVKAKYGLTDQEIERTFQYIGRGGYYDPNTSVPTISFEDAYFLANRDQLLERKVKEAQQQQLAQKKQRQQQAPVPHSGGSYTPPSEPQWDAKSIDEQLKKMGIGGGLFDY